MTEIKCKTNTRNKNEQEQRWLSCKKKKSLSFLFCAYKYKSRRESVFLVKKRRREWIFWWETEACLGCVGKKKRLSICQERVAITVYRLGYFLRLVPEVIVESSSADSLFLLMIVVTGTQYLYINKKGLFLFCFNCFLILFSCYYLL